ncbi:hypothetical protein [uncultured Clostridium sp.]|uniref:hypothetical protein n=1 Tax=uncultured Clostridium sp. TaxID=59620 RepID=UPI0028EF435C|nr:hypothetical protein [uncultured Clostridium sp.]
MSFISVMITERFLTVMADSRAVELYVNGDVHKVLDEDIDKIKILSGTVFVAVTGIVEIAQDFIDKSNLYEEIKIDGMLKNEKYLMNWFDKKKHIINTDVDVWFKDLNLNSIPSLRFRILFGGLTKDNELKAYMIDSDTRELSIIYYSHDRLGYNYSNSNFIDEDVLSSKFIELYKNYNGTADSILYVQAMLNDFVAQYDETVNTNKKSFKIVLP